MYDNYPYKSRVVEISAIGNPTTASAAPRPEPASSRRRDVGGSPSAGSAVLACALGYKACREKDVATARSY